MPACASWSNASCANTANFLKHDLNNIKAVKLDPGEVDFALLEGVALLLKLTKKSTPEMVAFSRWHRAVYPNEPGDELLTGVEQEGKQLQVHELPREAQLELGQFLLETYIIGEVEEDE